MERESPATPKAAEIRVDTPSLRAFARFMRRELSGAIAPLHTHVHPALESGAVVGLHLRSGDVESLNAAHAGCLMAATDTLRAYQQHLAVLADSAEAIAARYESSDALASSTLQAIDAQLGAAAAAATPGGGRLVHAGGAATIVG